MKLVVYTIPYEIQNEFKKINYLFENGLEELHLRKPGYSCNDYDKILSAIDSKFHSKVVIHDHFSLARKYNIGGIHISFNKSKSIFSNFLH